MHLSTYLDMLQTAEITLAGSYRQVARDHPDDADVRYICEDFAERCDAHVGRLIPILAQYEDQHEAEPERLHAPGLTTSRSGPVGLLRDLQDLYQLVNLVDITWTLVAQAGQGARGTALLDAVARCAHDTETQLAWLRMRMKTEAPQALLVAS